MFDFEKLIAYQKAKNYHHYIYTFLKDSPKVDSITRNQLRRAAFSVMLNIAEGAGRYSNADKRNFYRIARGSVFECVAILDFLISESIVSTTFYTEMYATSEELSKILMGLINSKS
ncbi:MAG: four helix bundle protein [Bacteroidia bacterium]|jgi:four helix bundle protein